MFITLDHNCIIALENPLSPSEAANANALSELMGLCKSQNIPVVVQLSMWMENPRPGAERLDLKARLEAVGLGHVEIREQRVLWFNIDGIPTADVGAEIGFLEWVHRSMFPNIAFRFYEFVEAECTKQGIVPKEMFEANRDKVRLFSPPLTPEEIANPTKQQLREKWGKWYRKWNNAKMDSLSICAHLSWGEALKETTQAGQFTGAGHSAQASSSQVGQIGRDLTLGHLVWSCDGAISRVQPRDELAQVSPIRRDRVSAEVPCSQFLQKELEAALQ